MNKGPEEEEEEEEVDVLFRGEVGVTRVGQKEMRKEGNI